MTTNTTTWSREKHLEDFSKNPSSQILVIGGGIAGAAIARLAGLNGISCTLLERGDYASGTSSRSSKMLHGGLRYLETFDFQQVLEGIKAREELFDEAPHLCTPQRFLIPIKTGDWWMRLKLAVGLWFYGLMVTKKERKHLWIPREKLVFGTFNAQRKDLMGCYSYCDGTMDDTRMVIENILHARELGSRCLNYMEVKQVEKTGDKFLVTALETFSGKEYHFNTDLVINCAGPWIPYVGHKETEPLKSRLRYSAGVHLIFNKPWNNPCMFIPMEGKSRYYFVWPHPGGTMVGTTEREVTELPLEQFPTEGEIEEILDRIKKDLPGAGLSRENLHYAYAGVRTLPVRDGASGVATLSRKHIWQDCGGVLSLLGGKYTTYAWTAYEGIKIAAKKLEIYGKMKSLSGLKFPGAGTKEEYKNLEEQLLAHGVERNTAHRIVCRLGTRAAYLLADRKRLEQFTPNLLQGELELGFKIEQAMTIEDLLRRRTEVEYLPGAGLKELQNVAEFLCTAGRPIEEILERKISFQSRINKLYTLMKGSFQQETSPYERRLR